MTVQDSVPEDTARTLAGRTILMSGGSRGIGRTIVESFARASI